MLEYSSWHLAKYVLRWCSWPNTSPCHGEDRRFESDPERNFYLLHPTALNLVSKPIRV